MLRKLIQKAFDVREGEFRISFYMMAYIFLVIAVLLIIKPTVNAQFLSRLGVEQLPFAFLLVAIIAIVSSFFYSKALAKFSLRRIIEFTLISTFLILIGLGTLLALNSITAWLLYFFYVWVAIYAVLSASQFWVLGNLVFNAREAKRLFGFIGAGAIMGGIFGGYLTSILAPLIGNENLIFIAAFLLLLCIPLIRMIWKLRVIKLNDFKKRKRTINASERPFSLIKKSRHLTYIAAIVAVSVLVAKLVDYLFSDFASASIPDPEELAAFFAFWFSTFNLLSLVIQLFFTHRIVGIWGVGFSLLLLPIGILGASFFFLILPEISVVIVIKAMDGILKQSVHKSASELLALPLEFDLKNRTKSFIDVVVDSVATGVAGFVLIFVVRGLELPSIYIAAIIIALVGVWMFFIFQVRKEYFQTFRKNLELVADNGNKNTRTISKKASVVRGMKSVFMAGTEEQILYMLKKLLEINDSRFIEDVQNLLSHPSVKVRTAAIQNLYYLRSPVIISEVPKLLQTNDEQLILATLEYLLLYAEKDKSIVFDSYLDHENEHIAEVALYCLAKEGRDNPVLKNEYNLKQRIQKVIDTLPLKKDDNSALHILLKTIGFANIPEFHPIISSYLIAENEEFVSMAIEAAGLTISPIFISDLTSFLSKKRYRNEAITALHNYGAKMMSILTRTVQERLVPLESCRCIPMVIKTFNSQEAVRHLFFLLDDNDLTIRLEVIRALNDIRRNNPELKFNKYKVAAVLFEECRLHHQTLSAMHTQIIISYRNRKKSKGEISVAERDARNSLLELLERRLDTGLERIFKLLGLKYDQNDIEIAYEGLRSERQEARINAIEFLDNLLTGNLKSILLPIIEDTVLELSSAEVLQKIKHKIPTETECFQLLLQGKDLKIKLAVLFLIQLQGDSKYVSIVEKYVNSDDLKIRTFAKKAIEAIQTSHPIS